MLFKMDKSGEGQEVVAADLAQNRDPSFIGFTHQMFLEVPAFVCLVMHGTHSLALTCRSWRTMQCFFTFSTNNSVP